MSNRPAMNGGRKLTKEQMGAAIEEHGGNYAAAAKALKIPRATLQHHVPRDGAPPKKAAPFQIEDLPDPELDAPEIIAYLKRHNSKKIQAHKARQLINVDIRIDGPICLTHLGDPHIDNAGTDWTALESDLKVIKNTEGMFACNVGDTHDNWAGRLAAQYAFSPSTKPQTKKLIEWLCNSTDWLYFLLGNHDIWTGGDPLHEFMKNSSGAFEEWAARLNLRFPNGTTCRVNARHDFPGSSQWNTAHGPGKAAQMGWRDHILTCGHRHTSGYMPIKDPASGLVSHALRVASYKIADPYAVQNGFLDLNISPCASTIINPYLPDEHGDKIKVYYSTEEAADYLKHLRRRYAKKAA